MPAFEPFNVTEEPLELPPIPRGDYTLLWVYFFLAMVLFTALYVIYLFWVNKLCPANSPPSVRISEKEDDPKSKPIGRWKFLTTKQDAFEAASSKSNGLKPIIHKPHKIGDYCHYHPAGKDVEECGVLYNDHFQFGPKWIFEDKKPNPFDIPFDEVYEYQG